MRRRRPCGRERLPVGSLERRLAVQVEHTGAEQRAIRSAAAGLFVEGARFGVVGRHAQPFFVEEAEVSRSSPCCRRRRLVCPASAPARSPEIRHRSRSNRSRRAARTNRCCRGCRPFRATVLPLRALLIEQCAALSRTLWSHDNGAGWRRVFWDRIRGGNGISSVDSIRGRF